MKKKVLFLFMTLMLVTSLVVTGCPAPAPEPQKSITIGVSLALTGFAATYGIPTKRAGEMLFEKINEAGGITIDGEKHLIKWIVYDDKYDATEGAIIATRLIHEDEVDIFTVYSGSAAVGATPISHAAGKLQWGASYGGETPSPDFPLVFARFTGFPEMMSQGMLWLVKNYPEVKRVAIMAVNIPVGHLAVKMDTLWSDQLGLDLVATELFAPGTADFSAILLRVLAQNPDLIENTGTFPTDSALIIKQARELGYTGMFTQWGGSNLWTQVEIAGAEAMEGFIGGEFGEPLPPELAAFGDEYLERYGPPFLHETIPAYASWQVLMQGIELAGTTESEALAQALRTGEFDTIAGKTHFGGKEWYGIDNQILHPQWLATVQGGEVIHLDIIKTFEYPEK